MSTQQAIPFEILHLNDEGYHLKIVASINDVQLSLILDTGASQTAFFCPMAMKIYGKTNTST
jgi:predicted aspartyl protease